MCKRTTAGTLVALATGVSLGAPSPAEAERIKNIDYPGGGVIIYYLDDNVVPDGQTRICLSNRTGQEKMMKWIRVLPQGGVNHVLARTNGSRSCVTIPSRQRIEWTFRDRGKTVRREAMNLHDFSRKHVLFDWVKDNNHFEKVVPGRDCGRENQRACKIWEGIPSCNSGLVEVLGKGICVDPNKAGSICGRENQRPCTVTERVPSCNPGLVEDFLKGRCVATADTPRVRLAERKLAELGGLIASKIGLAQEVASDPRVKASLESNPQAVERLVNPASAGQTHLPDGNLIRTMTVGATAGAKVFIGGSAGAGVAIDLTGHRPAYLYGTADWSASVGVGASAGIDVGFWVCQNNKIGGDSWGLEFGPADLFALARVLKGVEGAKLSDMAKKGPDVGIALWFDYDELFQGFTLTPGLGVGADFGGLVKAGTVVEDDPTVNCDGSPRTTTRAAPRSQNASQTAAAHGAVTFYQDCGYQGYSVTVPAGRHTLASLQAMGIRDNDISSVRVAPGSTVRIYARNGFGGTWQDLSQDVPCLVEHGFNDALSSAVVQ